jgi:3'-phosphoadenosine 5'-phosphosulfate sulfotransferase (PAPS reductase)/FAD synthetase
MNEQTETLILESPDPNSNTETAKVPSAWLGSDFLAVSYGGGTNSTAMLCAFVEMGIRPDLITFADTGAEMPHTYEHVAMMTAKVKEWWGIELITVRKLYQGKFEGLEGQALRHRKMPSISYGRRSCSVKYKHEPQDRELKKAMKAAGATMAIKCIGFDAGEAHRVKAEHLEPKHLNKKMMVKNWYPLVEMGWRRAECVDAIKRHGLPQPGKSSCFFCGASKKREVIALAANHPDLAARALLIEELSQKNHRTVRGLGGENNFWKNWLAQDLSQQKLWDDIEPIHLPCGCYDESAA